MKNLPVIFKSQWDVDAGGTNNDCGPASVAQILNYYGEKLTTNDVFKRTAAGLGLISWNQLINAIDFFGYKSHLERKSSLSRVRQLVDTETPPILLVHYGSLKSTQDKKFNGGHFFTVVGYHDDGFYVNDSDFKGDRRSEGDHHNYLNDELNKAWADCTLDGNQAFSLLWIERKSDIIVPDMSQGWMRQMFLESGVDIDKPEGEIRGRIQDVLDGYKKYGDLQIQVSNLQKQVAFETGQAAQFETELQQANKNLQGLQSEINDLRRVVSQRDAEISKLTEAVESLQAQVDPGKVVILTKEEYAKLTSSNGLEAYGIGEILGSLLQRILRRQKTQ